MSFIISEIVEVRINGTWYEAEILDVSATGVYVYVFDLRIRKNVKNADVR